MIIKAQAGVPGAKDYLGTSDGAAKGKRAGTEEWVKQAIFYSQGALWNNGTFAVRDIKGKPGQMSVHATGRAMDLSYRKTDSKGVARGRNMSKQFIDKVVANANALGVQMIIDYWPTAWGRAYRCDRQAWKSYETKTVTGAPGGDWWHIEINPGMADNSEAVKQAFKTVFEVSTNA